MCARIGLCGELAVKSPIAIKIKSRPQPHSTDVSILCDLFPPSSSFPSDFGYSHHADRYHCHLIFSILIRMINTIAINIKSRPQPQQKDKKAKKQKDKNIKRQKDKKTKMPKKNKKSKRQKDKKTNDKDQK